MISCKELAQILEWGAVRAKNELDIPTEALMVVLQTEAKSYIGNYQEGWAPLAESTLLGGTSPEGFRYPGKIELGYAPPDNPLLRTGQMRDSIEQAAASTGGGAMGMIGSDDPVALWQEMGTKRGIPPRPFLALAMMKSQEPATVIFGEFAMSLLMPK